jgi:hypothetical protein
VNAKRAEAEQQKIRHLEEQPGQHRAHLPTARGLGQRPTEVLLGEAQARQDAGGFVLGVMQVVVRRALVQVAQALGRFVG